MGVLQRFERRIENLVHRPFARAFKAEVQPVEIASALQRELDDRAAVVARGRTMVPNTFVVELGDHDHERLVAYAEPLGAELADMVREHAEDQQYSFIGPVEVTFEHHEDLATGMFRVRSAAVAGTNVDRRGGARGEPARGGRPAPYLEVNGARYPLEAPATVVGRGSEADLRIDDPGISRRHASVRVSPSGGVSIVDLGSTNGVHVDGRRMDEVTLRDGDEIVLGSTTLVLHTGGER